MKITYNFVEGRGRLLTTVSNSTNVSLTETPDEIDRTKNVLAVIRNWERSRAALVRPYGTSIRVPTSKRINSS